VGKTKEQRADIRGKFQVVRDVSGMRIGLIDDVFTTGATLNEASRVLKGAGAKAVYCVTALATE
jgi:predicted amidophosphoribosyltransferase